MHCAAEHPKQRRSRRTSDKGEEVERAVLPKVKQEERSDAVKQEVPKRRVEEAAPTESKRKTAVAASQKETVVDKAARLARKSNRMSPTQRMIRTQTVVIVLSLSIEALGAQPRNIVNQIIGGRMMAAAVT